jgi:hydroxymethylbilane synthase
LEIHPLRGNVDTRLRKLESGDYDAIILALSGLRRLDRTELVRQVLPLGVMCPAAGQGALAIEIRAGDEDVRTALEFLDNSSARSETECERVLLKKLGGGCQVPIGANAKFDDGTLHLETVVASPDGKVVLRESASGSDSQKLGDSVAEALLNRGGASILEAVYGRQIAVPQQP